MRALGRTGCWFGCWALLLAGCGGTVQHPAERQDAAVVVVPDPGPGEETGEPLEVAAPRSLPADADWVTPIRDPRPAAARPRAPQLLVAELLALRRLLAHTTTNDPDELKIRRRLAETYVELRYAAELDERRAMAAVRGNDLEARDVAATASEQAVEQYRNIVHRYPDDDQHDSTLYYLAFEYEHQGALDDARRTYLELIQRAPGSERVPAAYLAFGELFLEAAREDPAQWALARAAYEEVAKYPPPANRGACLAQYRLVEVNDALGNRDQAQQAREKALSCSQEHDLPGSREIRAMLRHR